MANERESPFLRFWGQMVRWLAGRPTEVSAEASVAADTDKAVYEPDEPIQISAVVRDAEGEGTTAAKVQAKIQSPGGRLESVHLATQPGPGGHYHGTFEPKFAGDYEITVEAQLAEMTIASAKLAVEVGRPNLEFEKLDLDEATLIEIADDTGGRYVHLSTADSLVDQFRRAAHEKREYLQARLYWPPAFWLLFVGLLTTEWVLRRRFMLR